MKLLSSSFPSPRSAIPCARKSGIFCSTIGKYSRFIRFSFSCNAFKLSPISLVVLGKTWNFSVACLYTSLASCFLKDSHRIFPVGKTINNKRSFPITLREIHFLSFKCFTASVTKHSISTSLIANAAISNSSTTRSDNIDECPFRIGRMICTAMLTETQGGRDHREHQKHLPL